MAEQHDTYNMRTMFPWSAIVSKSQPPRRFINARTCNLRRQERLLEILTNDCWKSTRFSKKSWLDSVMNEVGDDKIRLVEVKALTGIWMPGLLMPVSTQKETIVAPEWQIEAALHLLTIRRSTTVLITCYGWHSLYTTTWSLIRSII